MIDAWRTTTFNENEGKKYQYRLPKVFRRPAHHELPHGAALLATTVFWPRVAALAYVAFLLFGLYVVS